MAGLLNVALELKKLGEKCNKLKCHSTNGATTMSRISFEKKDSQLILCYEAESDWLEKKLEDDQDFQIYKTFSFSKRDLISNDDDSPIGYEYKFVFGEKVQNYFRIDKEKLGANFDLYIDASLSIDQSWFVTSSSKRSRYQDKTGKEKSSSIYGNILYAFKNFYKHDKLFIDIDSDSNFEDDGLHITQSTYKHFVEIFPTATNVKYQALSIFTNLLKNELDVVDYEEIYSRYKSREISVHNKEDIKTGEICKQEKAKYLYAKDQLLKSLERSAEGEFIHEDEFSKLIAQIFCFLDPKYIKIQTKLNISDYTGARANCQADLSLIDCEGNIDLIEVKSPQAYPNLFRKKLYRNHYVPSGELSGAINQLEQYLKCLTKMTAEEIANKNPALQNEMGEIKLKAVHPKGYIIFGRDAASFNGDNINQKRLDFELIKNTYKDVVDIITFDELVKRFERIISFL